MKLIRHDGVALENRIPVGKSIDVMIDGKQYHYETMGGVYTTEYLKGLTPHGQVLQVAVEVYHDGKIIEVPMTNVMGIKCIREEE